MDKPDFKPGKGRRILAVLFALLSIVIAVLQDSLSSRLSMCAGLLFAWHIAFTPGPPLRTPLREVYNMAHQGWRTPLSSKLVALTAVALLVVSQYFALHGR